MIAETPLWMSIIWNVGPEILQLGPLSLRWYGLLFALGFFLGFFIVKKMFEADGAPETWLDSCFMAMILGAVVGARLGHVFFYDWGYYSQHPGEILAVWHGGLASHGGAMGILLTLWWFSQKVSRRSMFWILDKVAVPTALAGSFIRLGNLMNSEIIGKPSNLPWSVQFVNAQPSSLADVARHPVQVYEAVAYLISFGILYYVYWYTNRREKPGFIIGLFFVLIFGARLLLEYFKESQGGFESAFGNVLSTGQWLSIPFIAMGVYFMLRRADETPTVVGVKKAKKPGPGK